MRKATPNTSGMALHINDKSGVKIQINPTESHTDITQERDPLTSRIPTGKEFQAAFTLLDAYQDGLNMVATFQTLKHGLGTFYRVFEALEANYEPFADSVFQDAFFEGVQA